MIHTWSITHAVFLIIFTCKASSLIDHLLLSSSIQVSRILYSFSTAFRRSSRPADIRDTTLSSPPDGDLYTFTVTLEIKEDDGKGNYKYMITRAETHLHFICVVSFPSPHHGTVRMAEMLADLMYFIWYCSPAKSIKLILNRLITSRDQFSFSCCHLVSEMWWSEESGTWRRLKRGLVMF